MKRLFVLFIFMLFLTCSLAYAKTDRTSMPYIKMNGSKFYLYFSAKADETGSFINEYYKSNQSYASWDELIGLHHYPTAFYPIEHAKEFKSFLNAASSAATLSVDDKNNEALLFFTVVDNKRLPIILEFNIFRFVKSPICGTVGFQYARRYLLNNLLEADNIKKSFVKGATKYIEQVENVEIPDIVTVEIEKGEYKNPENLGAISKKNDKNKIANVEDKIVKKEIKTEKQIIKAQEQAEKLEEKSAKEKLKSEKQTEKLKIKAQKQAEKLEEKSAKEKLKSEKQTEKLKIKAQKQAEKLEEKSAKEKLKSEKQTEKLKIKAQKQAEKLEEKSAKEKLKSDKQAEKLKIKAQKQAEKLEEKSAKEKLKSDKQTEKLKIKAQKQTEKLEEKIIEKDIK